MVAKTVNAEETISSYGAYVETTERKKMQRAHDIARNNLNACAKPQKQIYDETSRFHRCNEGDLVWYLQVTRK